MFQVTKDYFDGDHDHGSYQSPYFETLDEAEAFKKAVWDDADDQHKWYSYYDDYSNEFAEPVISEVKAEKFNGEIKTASSYLEITYT